jgi:hypothetical protein
MKYFFALSFLLIVGCSSSTAPISPYAPGGAYYLAPGTFEGSWTPWINGFFTDTDFCTAVITEADSLITGTITNDSTKEILTLTGHHVVLPQIAMYTTNGPPDAYLIQCKSNFGDVVIDSNYLYFYEGNMLSLGCYLKQQPLLDTAEVSINCTRSH